LSQNESVPMCEGCTRRTFLARSALFAAAAALGACGGADTTAPSIASGTTINVANFPSLSTVGGIATTTLDGAPIGIARTGASQFVVVSRVCTHEGTTVNATDSTGYLCPNHGARFAEDGTWLGGQRTSSLHVYASSYNPTTNVITIG